MYSLNAAVPGQVRAVASDLYPQLVPFESIRADHSILVKRFGDTNRFDHLVERARGVLADTDPIPVTVTGIDYFTDTPRGADPVVYLAVESPALDQAHRDLVAELGAIEHLEGEDYTMHVTLARGGEESVARELTAHAIEPVSWTIDEFELYDASADRALGTIQLS